MAGKIKLTLPDGRTMDATEVGIEETTERWTDVKLSDGSSLRVKFVITGVSRVDGMYDPQGFPLYNVLFTPVIATTEVPDRLKQQRN